MPSTRSARPPSVPGTIARRRNRARAASLRPRTRERVVPVFWSMNSPMAGARAERSGQDLILGHRRPHRPVLPAGTTDFPRAGEDPQTRPDVPPVPVCPALPLTRPVAGGWRGIVLGAIGPGSLARQDGRRDGPRREVGVDQNDDAHEQGQRDAVPEHGAEDLALVSPLAGRGG